MLLGNGGTDSVKVGLLLGGFLPPGEVEAISIFVVVDFVRVNS